MTQVYSLDIDDIVRELNLGRATVKFILDRFSAILPQDRQEGRPVYAQETLSTLIRIKDLMDQGLLPTQIESALADAPQASLREGEDVRMSQDALAFIQTLFQDIKVHQNRIAQAHEKRAEAEERKAVAIEKRAEAEEKKAQAMNNIAAALQEMSRHRPVDVQTMEIAGQAAQALTMNETDSIQLEMPAGGESIDLGEGLNDTDLDDIFSPPGAGGELSGDADLEGLAPEDLESDDLGLEDLALEIAEPDDTLSPLDDLSLLVDESPDSGESELDDLLEPPGPLPDLDSLDPLDDLERLVDDGTPPGQEDLDDLSLLVEIPETGGNDMDDLSLLVDMPKDQTTPAAGLDDLYALVDEGMDSEEPPDLDDLSALVEVPGETKEASPDLDNLYALVDDGPGDEAPMDDLSLLVGDDPTPAQASGEMDDLSALVSSDDIDSPSDTAEPSLKPDITPEENMAKYKAAVMKIIIDLKNKGLSPAETTDRLNRDQVPTLSGKPQWREKAIAKIYGFIESAQ